MSWWSIVCSKSSQPLYFDDEERHDSKVCPRMIARRAMQVGHLRAGNRNLRKLDAKPPDLLPIGRNAYGCELYAKGFATKGNV